MKISFVTFSIWIDARKGKSFDNAESAQALLDEISALIKSRGYHIPEQMCGNNPHINISTV